MDLEDGEDIRDDSTLVFAPFCLVGGEFVRDSRLRVWKCIGLLAVRCFQDI